MLSDPYRNFGVKGDNHSLLLTQCWQTIGPSWDDFVECVNGGSIFAIITAKRTYTFSFRESIYNFIVTNHNGISKRELLKT